MWALGCVARRGAGSRNPGPILLTTLVISNHLKLLRSPVESLPLQVVAPAGLLAVGAAADAREHVRVPVVALER